ncbi:Cingulin-like protein 1 [Dissostichus eleginoides]|uniref:Cingulin-like protein 1 n=1 Tax=Dissostichus eleginoides TaxID=100907 RepID=A0AAD9BNS2_DISEL|nr:Cingulin-like protein 1 [Dissostichus eleginoides]
MKEDFVSRFDGLLGAIQEVQVDLKAVTVRITEAEDRISTNEDDVAALLAQNTAMKTTVEELVLKVDDLENRSRCSNLRLVGMLERKEGTDMCAFLECGYLTCLVHHIFQDHY